jgi:polysaccharide biosynthesis protein PslH
MATWTAMCVPIRFGGGTRVKISEAFVRRLPVVSTRLGAFGYDVESGRELLLADDPAAFAGACITLARDAGLADRLIVAAEKLFRARYSTPAIRQRIAAIAEHILRPDRQVSTAN